MEKIMNDNDSKAFLKEMARVYPKYKDNFGAVSNLIVLLMEELQKERKGRKEGEKYKNIYDDLEEEYKALPFSVASGILLRMRELKQKYFLKPKDRWHKINNIIYNLNTIGGKVDIKKLTDLLIELRDEEL